MRWVREARPRAARTACCGRDGRQGHTLAADLTETRPNDYYAVHGCLTLTGFAGAGLVMMISGEHGPRYDLHSFWPDDMVRTEFSHSAAELSDRLLWLSVATPLVAQPALGFDTALANGALIYGETQAANLFVATLTKEIVRRPRPYTHAIDPRIQELAEGQGSDVFASFFSGHASASHAAATAGSILFANRTTDLWSRHLLWGIEFGLTGITAQLRVRAGRHYRTDIWTGAAVGIGLGLLIPVSHGVSLSTINSSEYAVGAGALALTMIGSELVDRCDLLNVVGLCSLPRGVRVPVAPSADSGRKRPTLDACADGCARGFRGVVGWELLSSQRSEEE